MAWPSRFTKSPWFGGGSAETEAFFASSISIANVAGMAAFVVTPSTAAHAIHCFDSASRWAAMWTAFDLDLAIGLTDLKQLLDFVEFCVFSRS